MDSPLRSAPGAVPGDPPDAGVAAHYGNPYAEQRALAAGHDRISLYTNAAMVENQALYERIGYVETRRADDNGFARVFYEKTLARP